MGTASDHPSFLRVGSGAAERRIAYLAAAGNTPGLMWLSGFCSEMTSTKASALAEWASQLTYDQIPPEVRREARRCLLDYLGVTLGAADEDAVRIARETADLLGGNPQATIVGDLTSAPQIPTDAFDCAIVTQTLQFVYDVRAALATLHRVLAPGGVLLATMPGITKISPPEDEEYGEWWHFTTRSAQRLAEEAFGAGNVEVRSFGNVLSAAGFLYGLAASDLRPEELAAHDRLYEVIVGVRAVKRAT